MVISDQQHAPRRDHGFTLVEILVAIVLVGILSAVVVIGVSRITDKGETAACLASRDAATAAAMAYYAVNRTHPISFQQLIDGDHLTFADGVTVTATLTAQGSGWTLTMGPVGPATKPGFTCS